MVDLSDFICQSAFDTRKSLRNVMQSNWHIINLASVEEEQNLIFALVSLHGVVVVVLMCVNIVMWLATALYGLETFKTYLKVQ